MSYEFILDDEDRAAAGAMLAALIAADAPAFRALDLTRCTLGDTDLSPLLDALPHNTHLTQLCIDQCDMSDGFARGPLLEAVRANTSLRKLTTFFEAAAAAEQLVSERAAAV